MCIIYLWKETKKLKLSVGRGTQKESFYNMLFTLQGGGHVESVPYSKLSKCVHFS